MFKFDDRITKWKYDIEAGSVDNVSNTLALLNDALILIDELNAEYKRVWAQECNAQGALEAQAERIAQLTAARQDSFDSDPNNKD